MSSSSNIRVLIAPEALVDRKTGIPAPKSSDLTRTADLIGTEASVASVLTATASDAMADGDHVERLRDE